MPKSPHLPPFGIRDLLGAEELPALIQITAGQYKNTIKSQPDSVLQYIDEDDGEVIHVGSSLELKERLDDPITIASRCPRLKNPLDGEYVHVFDINRSSGSLAVWREHEAYSSKSFRHLTSGESSPQAELPNSVLDADKVHTITGHCLAQPVNNVKMPKGRLRFHGIHPGTEAHTINSLFTQCDGYSRSTLHCDENRRSYGCGVVSFYEESQAEMALERLQHVEVDSHRIDLDILPPTDLEKDLNEQATHDAVCLTRLNQSEEESNHNVESLSSLHPPVTAESILSGIEEHLGGLADVLQLAAQTLQKAANKTREADTSVVEDVLKGVKGILTEVGAFGSEVFKAFEAEVDTAVQPTILESDSTVNTSTSEDFNDTTEENQRENDQESFQDPTEWYNIPTEEEKRASVQSEAESPPSNLNSQSWASVPSPLSLQAGLSQQTDLPNSSANRMNESILDAENEDADFTARFPPLMSVRRAQTVSGTMSRSRYQPYTRRSLSSEIPETSTLTRPAVRFDVSAPFLPEQSSRNSKDDKVDPAESFYRALPGAWPEARNENIEPGLPTSSESSGAFFDRMTGRSRPAKSTYSFTATGLRRNNTTATTNPASRLNRPFDPGFPYGVSTSKGEAKTSSSSIPSHQSLPRRSKTINIHRQPLNIADLKPLPLPIRTSHRYQDPSPLNFQRHQPLASLRSGRIALPMDDTYQHHDLEQGMGPRHFRSVPNFRPRVEDAPPSTSRPTISAVSSYTPEPSFETHPLRTARPLDKVDVCVEQLKTLGFGTGDRNMANRLHVYAVAADGDITEAVEMIEQDRRAIRDLQV